MRLFQSTMLTLFLFCSEITPHLEHVVPRQFTKELMDKMYGEARYEYDCEVILCLLSRKHENFVVINFHFARSRCTVENNLHSSISCVDHRLSPMQFQSQFGKFLIEVCDNLSTKSHFSHTTQEASVGDQCCCFSLLKRLAKKPKTFLISFRLIFVSIFMRF